jgi:hypothetical protein
MSHSVVLVCLRPGADIVGNRFSFADAVNTALETALAPFDENAETERYKEFEEGDPLEFWLIDTFKRAAENVQNGTGILPYEPNEIGWSSASSKETPERQRRTLEEKAALWYTLPDVITWEDVVRLYRETYPADDPAHGIQYDEETGRAFEWSTYPHNVTNERGALVSGARWDWWQLGGRWTGYFQVKHEHVGSDLLAGGRPGTFTEANRDHRKTDAAPKGLIDFAAMRTEKADAAKAEWFAFNKFIKQYPETLSWKQFLARRDAGEITIEQARAEYREQPGVEALHTLESDFRWHDDPYDALRVLLNEYEHAAMLAAVPGWSLLTLEGEWLERGKMGFWGVSDATGESIETYNKWANEYLESLPDDVIIAAVDVHI